MTIKELRQIIREEIQTAMREELREILTEAVQIASKPEEEEKEPEEITYESRMPKCSEVSEAIRNSVSFEGGFGSLLSETARGMTTEDFSNLNGGGGSSANIATTALEDSFMERAKKVYEASLKVTNKK